MIYVASPYSHPKAEIREENYRKVAYLSADLCSEGKLALSPIVYGHTLVGFKEMRTDWDFWMNFCISLLERCDEMIVYKIEGWENSRGVKEEIEFAQKKGMKITYLEYNLPHA
jgi:hypothetical protein